MATFNSAGLVRLLDLVGIAPHELVPISVKTPTGWTHTNGTAQDAPARAADLASRGDLYWRVCPLVPGTVLADGERGRADQTGRISALFADLDASPDKLASTEACWNVVHALAGRLGGRQPVAVVGSGSGGLHPYWKLDAYPAGEHPRAVALARAFGMLVRAEAIAVGGAADMVSDPARVLRVPGSTNHKPGGGPVTLTAYDDGDPDVEPDSLTLDEVEAALADAGVRVMEPTGAGYQKAVEASGMARWPDSETCPYTRAMVAAWRTDKPGARHPWALSQCVRVFTARRLGCLSRADFLSAVRVLSERFAVLCRTVGVPRTPAPRELEGCLAWAQTHVEEATEEYLRSDFRHVHYGPTPAPGDLFAEDDDDRDEDGLWTASEELATIYRLAHHRMVAPEAMLGFGLLLVASVVPPHVVLPPLIGGRGSLNSFVALVGGSGGGKGAAERAAREGILLPEPVHVVAIGSGEGIAHQYAHREKNGSLVRDRDAVLFTASEVQGLGALGSRNGSTLDAQIRQAWSGEALGYAYADAGRRLTLDAHSYRFGLSVGVQPEHADVLLDEAAGGTPQRFVWLRTTDPAISRANRGEPVQPLTLPALDWTRPVGLVDYILPVCQEAEEAILSAHEYRMRGEGDALDGHALFAREKVAALLAVLHGRQEVTSEDWRLSGLVMARSDRTRASAQRVLSAEASRRSHAVALARGRAEVVVEDTKHAAGLAGAVKAIRKALTNGGGTTTRKAAKDAAGPRYRPFLDEAWQSLVTNGECQQQGGRWALVTP